MLKQTQEFNITTLNNLVQKPEGKITLLDVVLDKLNSKEATQKEENKSIRKAVKRSIR